MLALPTLARLLPLACLALIVAGPAALAAAPRDQQMLALSPDTRVEQRCNARAMGVVGREVRGFRPDEIVSYAFAEPVLQAQHFDAPGAALRSGGKWYHIAYSCQTSADGLTVLSFDYRLGAAVPREEWSEHLLVQ